MRRCDWIGRHARPRLGGQRAWLALGALLAVAVAGCGGAASPRAGATHTASPLVRGTPSPTSPLGAAFDGLSVYVATFDGGGSAIYALDARTGVKRWRVPIAPVYGAPAVANGIVYIVPRDRSVLALRADTGQKVWTFARQAYVDGYPTVSGGTVYVGTDDGFIYSFGAADGHLQWSFQAPGNQSHIYLPPAVVDGAVYFGTSGDDHGVYALDAATGRPRWHRAMPVGLDGTPLVAGGVLYLGAENGNLYALRASDGAPLWHFTTGQTIQAQPALAGGTVYVGSFDDTLYALDAGTGKPRWRYKTGDSIWSTPAVAGGIVYVGSLDGTLTALDAAAGAVRWRYQTAGKVRAFGAPIAVVDGVVITSSDDGIIHALDAATGHQDWASAVAGEVDGAPVVAP